MSKNLVIALIALVTILGFYSSFVMAEKFSFAANNNANPETKTSALQ